MKAKSKKYKLVFDCAKSFLGDIVAKQKELNSSILKEHLNQEARFDNLADANRRLIESLANRNLMANVIGFKAKEKVFQRVLWDFEPKKIILKYESPETLLKILKKEFHLKNVQNKRSLWRMFAMGIISGSGFMSAFRDKDAFDRFVKTFSLNKYTKAALPMLLSKEIKGLGFSLACDFLKEIGYRDYPKPDRHLIKIFTDLGLSPSAEPYEVYKSIIEMAEVVGEDAFTVDKYFWLISSGRFYLLNLNVGRKREKFIKYVKTKTRLQ